MDVSGGASVCVSLTESSYNSVISILVGLLDLRLSFIWELIDIRLDILNKDVMVPLLAVLKVIKTYF